MRILIVARGTNASEQALLTGGHLAQTAGEPATLLWVGRRKPSPARLEKELDRHRQFLQTGSGSVETRARFGRLSAQILLEAQAGAYDLILVGEDDRRSGWLRKLFGSPARTVAERAPCAVLVVKGQARPLRHVLLCDSGAVSPSLLDRFTAHLSGVLSDDPQITVLHVMSQMSAGPGVRGTQLRADADELIAQHTPEGEMLEHDLEVLGRSDLDARPKIRHGLVVDEILREARSGDYDLVVIGAHPEEGWRRILLENLTRRLLDRLDRPVLVVR